MSKNILLVVPRLNIGGAETYVATVARGLKSRGYNVFAASGGGRLADELRREGIKHFFVPVRLNARLAAWLLARLVRKYKIDVLHANSAAAGIAAVRLKTQFPELKIVYTAHGVFGHTPAEMTINGVDKIIGVSDFVTEFARQKGFDEAKLTTIYTGIDTAKFKPNNADRVKLRESFNIPQDKFVLALVARIANLTHKGHADLVEVMQKAKDKNWQLVFIGKGKALGKLKLLTKTAGIGANVTFIGHTRVELVLDMVDAVVLPSKLETFGLSLAEAMAMGKPVVAYAVGGTPEVLGSDKTGLLVELNNRQELYEKIKLLADNTALRASLGKAGRQRVIEKFSLGEMLDKIEAVYNEK